LKNLNIKITVLVQLFWILKSCFISLSEWIISFFLSYFKYKKRPELERDKYGYIKKQIYHFLYPKIMLILEQIWIYKKTNHSLKWKKEERRDILILLMGN